ncbi:lectin-like [Saccostrea echinata]|uniref:lectin-like n=1 Tax=Saccostrea echinata TaxID=191078 RepID=UPI002A7F785E|nr:lectin-like [Saccostrea echinata]
MLEFVIDNKYVYVVFGDQAMSQNFDSENLEFYCVEKGAYTVWIGGSDRQKEDTWAWTENGDLLSFTFWGEKQPNNYHDQDCLALFKEFDFLWADEDYTIWIGGTDNVIEGDWAWIGSGDQFNFSDWGQSQPDNISSDDDCLCMHKDLDFKWADDDCNLNNFGYICKKTIQ